MKIEVENSLEAVVLRMEKCETQRQSENDYAEEKAELKPQVQERKISSSREGTKLCG